MWYCQRVNTNIGQLKEYVLKNTSVNTQWYICFNPLQDSGNNVIHLPYTQYEFATKIFYHRHLNLKWVCNGNQCLSLGSCLAMSLNSSTETYNDIPYQLKHSLHTSKQWHSLSYWDQLLLPSHFIYMKQWTEIHKTSLWGLQHIRAMNYILHFMLQTLTQQLTTLKAKLKVLGRLLIPHISQYMIKKEQISLVYSVQLLFNCLHAFHRMQTPQDMRIIKSHHTNYIYMQVLYLLLIILP